MFSASNRDEAIKQKHSLSDDRKSTQRFLLPSADLQPDVADSPSEVVQATHRSPSRQLGIHHDAVGLNIYCFEVYDENQ